VVKNRAQLPSRVRAPTMIKSHVIDDIAPFYQIDFLKIAAQIVATVP